MSKSSKRRNRLGAFLAVLSLATTARNNFASAGNNQYVSSQDQRVISDVEWKNILSSFKDVNECKEPLGDFSSNLSRLQVCVGKLNHYAMAFENKMSEPHLPRPGIFSRFLGSDAVEKASTSIEQKANAAWSYLSEYCSAISDPNNGLISCLNGFFGTLGKSFNGVFSVQSLKADYDNMHLNILDLNASLEKVPDEVERAKDSSVNERYTRYEALLIKMRKALGFVKEINDKVAKIWKVAGALSGELSTLEDKVNERNSENERKRKEEQERREREAQEKREREKKAAEEQRQKEMEEAKRNKAEAEKKFFKEKSNWHKEFSGILDRASKGFEAICAGSDPDVGELIKRDQGSSFAEFRAIVESEIEMLSDLKEYSEINLQKVIDMRVKSLDIEDQKRKLEKSIKDYRDALVKKKKSLESSRNDVMLDVGKLKEDLFLTWDEEDGKLISSEDKDRFRNMAQASLETAKKIVDQMLQEVGQFKIDLTRNSEGELKNLTEKFRDRKDKVLRSIDSIKNKGLSIRIVGMKDSINGMFKERDKLWTEFKNKYEPARLTDDLRAKTSDIWKSIEGIYNEELSWSKSMDEVLKSRDINDSVAEKLDELITDLSGRLGTWKNVLRDHELSMQEFIEQIQVSEARKLSFKRIFSSEGSFDLVRRDVGGSSVNSTASDSAKIADVIDNFLPGTHDVILSYADASRRGGYGCILVSGDPGWGKTQGVKYFASAIGARVVPIDYDKLKEGDGGKYADSLFQTADGGNQPWILLFDELDSISSKVKSGENRMRSAAVLNNFLNRAKQYMEDGNTNCKLIVCLSNENKDKFDEANFSRMTGYKVLGNNPDYKRIVSIISAGVKFSTSDVSKEHAISKIARHCDTLMLKGRKVSARTLNQAFLSIAKEFCDGVNKDRSKGDPNYVELYNAQISADAVCDKINSMSGIS